MRGFLGPESEHWSTILPALTLLHINARQTAFIVWWLHIDRRSKPGKFTQTQQILYELYHAVYMCMSAGGLMIRSFGSASARDKPLSETISGNSNSNSIQYARTKNSAHFTVWRRWACYIYVCIYIYTYICTHNRHINMYTYICIHSKTMSLNKLY